MKKINFLWKYEKYFFCLFVLISLIPIVSNKFFPTVDGPAHLHNANLLKHIWFYRNKELLNFFDLNTHLNSNIINHLWFAVSGLFLPAFLVEKSILIFYVISLPFAFRFLVGKISSIPESARISSYLIFPFIYSFTLRIGFFNFCIGIPILFWTLGLWIKYKEKRTVRIILWLMGLATLLYFSHLFVFILFAVIIFSLELSELLKEFNFKTVLIKFFYPWIILSPGIILFILFVFFNNAFSHAPSSFLPPRQLIKMLLEFHPIITLDYQRELLYARIISYAIGVLIILAIINGLRKNKSYYTHWTLPLIVVLVLYFIFPDWIASGGYISIRWALFFLLMLIVWIASRELPVKQLFLPVMVILVIHTFFINYHHEQTKFLSRDAEELVKAEPYLEKNKVLLPLNYSTNWIQINHACYMATQKAIINLDNYEPTKPHFPLIWKKGEQVYDIMKKYGNRNPPCINIDAYERQTNHRIDYISQWYFNGDNSDSCSYIVMEELQKRFELIYHSENKKLLLYKRKSNT